MFAYRTSYTLLLQRHFHHQYKHSKLSILSDIRCSTVNVHDLITKLESKFYVTILGLPFNLFISPDIASVSDGIFWWHFVSSLYAYHIPDIWKIIVSCDLQNHIYASAAVYSFLWRRLIYRQCLLLNPYNVLYMHCKNTRDYENVRRLVRWN